MTRIMLRLILLLLGEGLILLSSGDTTVSVVQDATESPQLFSLPISSEPLTEDNLLREETTVGSNDGSTDLTQIANQTSKESDAKDPVEHTAASVGERKDSNPTSTDAVSETETMPMNTRLDPQSTALEAEDIVDSTEQSSENETHDSGEKTDSTILAKDSGLSEKKTEAMTTYLPKSSTRKRSLISTTDASEFDEETTTALSDDVVQPQTSHDSIIEESSSVVSVYEDSSSSEETSEIGMTEKADNITASAIPIPHRSYDLEKEETTPVSKDINDERESEFLEMAGTEDHIKLVPSQVQSIVVSPKVVVMSQKHDVLNPSETKMAIEEQNQENGVGSSKEVIAGVIFDPDGMTHDGPQDPDSVVFHVPEDSREIEFDNEEDIHYEVIHKEHEKVQIEKESNPNEREIVSNGTKKFEKLEHFYTESNIPENENVEVPLKNSPNPISFGEGATLPEFQIHNNSAMFRDESEEMLQDAPHGVNMLPEFAQSNPDKSVVVTEKHDVEQNSSGYSIENTHATGESEKNVVSTSTSDAVGSVSQLPDQSVIRPVKVKISSPSENLSSTSILPGSFSTQSGVSSTTVSNPSVPTAGLVDKVVESSSPGSSSPILPDPAVKVDGNVEVSTLITQPELVDLVNTSATPNITSNSTISEIAVKTSVSVSSSNSNRYSQSSQQSTSSNSSIDSMDLPTAEKESNETSFTTSLTPTTTEAAGIKIRKPKLKIGAGGPTRQPYIPPRPAGRATTEAGPPVSIFKKQRTRIASITSSTTARPFRAYSTIRIHYATHHGMAILPPGGELIVSTEPVPITTTEPPTTTTEEPIEEEPFTDQTVMPVIADEEDTTLVKVAGFIALDRGIRWHKLLDNRQTPEYKRNAEMVLLHLERLFRSSPIATRLWKIEIDGFSGSRSSRPVGVDFFLYLIKSTPVAPEHLESIFREKLTANRTFGTYRVDVDKTAFEVLQEEPLVKATPAPDDDDEGAEPPIPQWAIACIVIGAASLIFIVLFAAVTLYGRHHMRRRYSSKLSEEEGERSSGEWESKMAAAYENMAADTLYDADENTYKKHTSSRIATFHGVPSPLTRSDSWSNAGRPPRWTSHFD